MFPERKYTHVQLREGRNVLGGEFFVYGGFFVLEMGEIPAPPKGDFQI